MTQITQEKSGDGNSIHPPQRKRHWCFTVNNYTNDDIAQIHKEKELLSCKSYCFQEEKGESGTPHLQGVISYKNAKTLSMMRKILPKAHWEVCRNVVASYAYCSKKDTRI